jgi:hypothetical protein
MFKELKVLKLVIALSILIVILFTINFDKYTGVLIFSSESSFRNGEDLTIGYVSFINNAINQEIKLCDWKGNEIARIAAQNTIYPQSKWDIFRHGPGEIQYHQLLKGARSNLYFVNDSIPLIVTSCEPRDITVVLPQTGQLLVQRFFGMNAFDTMEIPLWKNRPLAIDDKTKQLLQWLNENYAEKDIQFATDLAEDFKDVFHQSKVVIVYGYNRFVSQPYHDALKAYYQEGGKILFISTYLPQHIINTDGQQLSIALDSSDAVVNIQDKFIPFTYLLGGQPVSASMLKVEGNKDWPSNVPFFANGAQVSGGGEGYYYTIAIESSYSYQKMSGIGYATRMISIPSDEWLAPNNFEKKEVRDLTKWLLDELLK